MNTQTLRDRLHSLFQTVLIQITMDPMNPRKDMRYFFNLCEEAWEESSIYENEFREMLNSIEPRHESDRAREFLAAWQAWTFASRSLRCRGPDEVQSASAELD